MVASAAAGALPEEAEPVATGPPLMSLAVHVVVYNQKGEPVRCAAGKTAEKARQEAEKIGYTSQETTKDRCPLCNPSEPEENGHDRIEVNPDRGPEFCHGCGGVRFTLSYREKHLLRLCKDCGAEFDLHNMKPWEE